MFCRYILALAALLLLLPAVVDPVAAQRPGDRDRGGDWRPGDDRGRGDDRRRDDDRGGDWELLGSARVGGFGVDHDVIEVGRREGRFARIGIEAENGAVFVIDITVVFGNGEVQRIDVRRRFAPGERSPPLDLQGRGRPIKRLEIAARAGHDIRRRGILNVYGEPIPDRGPDRGRDRESWELLGQNNIGFGTNREVIRVGREGRFSAIVLEVSQNEVNFQGLTVFYVGGPPQHIDIRQSISPGRRTDPIALADRGRGIDRIEFVYVRHPGFRGRANVLVYGLRSGGGPPRDARQRWEELGCQKVGFGADRDVIRVGRQEGRFSAIRLRVDRSDIVLISLRVVYERGSPDEYQVNTRIRAGSETQPLDLRGERRSIREIEFVYTSIPSFRGSATLCADGRQ